MKLRRYFIFLCTYVLISLKAFFSSSSSSSSSLDVWGAFRTLDRILGDDDNYAIFSVLFNACVQYAYGGVRNILPVAVLYIIYVCAIYIVYTVRLSYTREYVYCV